jgi:hypothetical protein
VRHEDCARVGRHLVDGARSRRTPECATNDDDSGQGHVVHVLDDVVVVRAEHDALAERTRPLAGVGFDGADRVPCISDDAEALSAP